MYQPLGACAKHQTLLILVCASLTYFMASKAEIIDQPMTPGGNFFLRREFDTVIIATIGFEQPIDVEAMKSAIANSSMLQLPRFCSLVVLDQQNGAVRGWKRIPKIDINRHFIVQPEISADDDTDAVKQYIEDLAATRPMATDKPMWEFHVLSAQRHLVLRLHHALGDGISLMSMFQSCFGKSEAKIINDGKKGTAKKKGGSVSGLWYDLKYISAFLVKSLLVGDRKTAVSGGPGVELCPRKLATADFLIDDMKLIKRAVPNATINDVVFTIIASGLSRYLIDVSPKGLGNGLRLTGICAKNMRDQPGLLDVSDMMKNNSNRWGNQFSAYHIPFRCRKAAKNPLEYLRNAKAMLDRKKHSREPRFFLKIRDLVTNWFGPKACSLLFHKVLCNTTFYMTNVPGPIEEIVIAGNRVTHITATMSNLPQALGVVFMSYAGKAIMQLSVAKDIIPHPELLSNFIQEAFLEMKEATLANH